MSDVVVICPGCTDFDEQHRIQGSLDLPLNERGEEQVAELAEELRKLPLEAIYTGDCEPARATAEALGRELGIEVRELDGLRNLDQGLWQGLQFEEVRRKYPKVFRQWQEEPENICPPQGETVHDALVRVQKALHRPLKKRGMIGVVASEPLATLIACMIQGCRPVIPDPPAEPNGKAPGVRIVTPGRLSSTTPSGENSMVASADGEPGTAAENRDDVNGHVTVSQVKPS